MTDPRLEPPPSTLPPGSTVWAYLRDSGGPSQDRSVEQQREIIEEYCARHGLVLIHPPFEDVHKSGTSTHNRTEFEFMMSLSASERLRPKGLLIWNHARFSRGGPYDVQFYKSTLRQRGIIIHSLTDKIPEGKFAPVIESLIETANQAKAEEAAMGAWRGLRHLVKQGAVPGTPPKGIRRVPITVRSEQGGEHVAHRWEPDPHFEHRILTAFEMKAAGKSLAQIHRATRLYGSLNGYTTFFQNCIYIGTLKFGDLIIEKYCKPIIPKRLWTKVQSIIAAHASRLNVRSASDHPRRVNATYSLSGIIKCARCGSPMNGLTSRQPSGKDYRRYRCNNAKQKLTCTAKPIPAALLEKLVIKELVRFFEEETNLIELLSHFSATQAEHHAAADTAIASHRAELGAVRKGLNNTANAIAQTGGSATLLKKLTQLEAQESHLTNQISQLETQKSASIIIPSKAQAKASARRIIESLQNEDSMHVRQTILGLVHEVLADRQGRNLTAQVVMYFDKKKDKTVSMVQGPVGAPIYRHSLKIQYLIQKQGNALAVK